MSHLLRLILALTVIAVAWLIALPWIARRPAEYQRWAVLQKAGIDPSAMYYSELEAMKPILVRLNLEERSAAKNTGPALRWQNSVSVD